MFGAGGDIFKHIHGIIQKTAFIQKHLENTSQTNQNDNDGDDTDDDDDNEK